MIIEEVKKTLPNPDGVWITKDVLVTRQQCVKQCQGCRNMFSDENKGDVCIPWGDPKSKWRNFFVDFGTKVVNGQDVKVEYPNNPCIMATHMKHSPKNIKAVQGKVRRGQQKSTGLGVF